jgi:GrpB-like predicted nucleotidyltransferase (UPF0157 family)
MIRKVEVAPYDPNWAHAFQAEADEIRRILGQEVMAVHHIGSTSIPNLSAKPIIDLLVEVRDIEKIDASNDVMSQLGYLPKGENGIPGRRYFIKGDEIHRTHHLHIFQTRHPDIERHLNFRDYLIAHPEDAQVYGRLKQELARRFPADIDSYVAGKDEFIKEIDRKAQAWRGALPPDAIALQ